ncbi:hypothetical protein T03_15734 [Trichinella britovi]|uniref:Uncharacterized protein n=1 Tax=Trichinella britovi TaxID=45882 RepID=A0A0V0Z2R2_TRIBR|nr:hypothetical protein T03_15734 [Trichinella britovi]
MLKTKTKKLKVAVPFAPHRFHSDCSTNVELSS